MGQDVEIEVTREILTGMSYGFVETNESGLFTGEFDDVQWDPGTLYWSPLRAAPGSLFHELGHLLGGTEKEIRSVNWTPDGNRHQECEDRAVGTQAILYYYLQSHFSLDWVKDALEFVEVEGAPEWKSYSDMLTGPWCGDWEVSRFAPVRKTLVSNLSGKYVIEANPY